jgi:hypothetical protein
MKKRIAGIVLLILAQNAFAQSGNFGSNLTWKFSGGMLTISGNGEMPDTISTGNPPWNAHKASITSVVIENGITAIGNYSFNGSNHKGLQSVTIASSVTRIGSWAFENCTALTSVVIHDSVTTLGSHAFSGCTALASATIGSGVTKILAGTFFKTGLTSITIPKGIVEIAGGSFSGCTRLTTINYNAANAADLVFMGVKPFDDCNALKTIIFGDSVRRIPDFMFYGQANVQTITMGSGVTHIGESAFHNCTQLSSLTIGNGVIEIGTRAFMSCSNLREVIIPDSVTIIKNSAFDNCPNLNSLTIGSGVSKIEAAVFRNSGITSLTIPENISEIGNGAFFGSSRLRTVYFNAENCNDFIGTGIFENCRVLSTVIFGDRVRRIPGRALIGMESLDEVTIGSRVNGIGHYAFDSCKNIMEITIKAARPPALHSSVFYHVDKSFITLNVPTASLNAYKSAEGWKDFQISQ